MSFILFVYRMNMPSSLSLFSIVFFFITPFNLLLFLCVSSKFPPILYIYIYIFQPSAQTYGQSSSSFLTSMDQSITISFILHFFFERTQKGWRKNDTSSLTYAFQKCIEKTICMCIRLTCPDIGSGGAAGVASVRRGQGCPVLDTGYSRSTRCTRCQSRYSLHPVLRATVEKLKGI